MNDATRMLVGSQSRDDFKRRHKDLDRTFYACDLDLCWVSKNPPSILAVLDYKKDGDQITFSEVVAYCDLIEQDVKVLIVQGDCETGQFCIQQFVSGDYRPYPPKVELAYMADTESWEDFGDFQREFRRTEEARKRSIQKGFSQ